MAEYNIPIGSDLEPFIQQLRGLRGEIAKTGDEATKAGQEISDAYKTAASGASVLSKAAVDNANASKELAKNIDGVNLTYKDYIKSLEQAGITQEQLNTSLETSILLQKKNLEELPKNSKQYKALAKEIEAAEVGLNTLRSTSDKSGLAIGKLSKTLNDQRAVLQQLAAAGLTNTKVYKDLEKEAAKTLNAIKNTQDSLRILGSDTAGLDNLLASATAITGAFSVAQGAVALFGKENENIEKALLKVNAAMSILNGLQAIQAELKRKDSLASKAAAAAQAGYAFVVGTSTGALKLFRIALASTGIGLLVIGLATLIANFDKVKEKVLELVPGLSKVAEFFGKITTAITDFVGITSEAERALDALNKKTAEKNKELDRTIGLLEAQGNKERDIFLAKEKQLVNELDLLGEIQKTRGKLSDEELAKQQDINFELEKLRIGETRRIREEAEKQQEEQDKKRKERLEKEKKAAEDRLAIEKDLNERLISLDKQYRDLKIEATENERSRLIAAENARFEDELDAIQKNIDNFKGSEDQKSKLVEAAQRVREQLATRHFRNLASIEQAFFDRRTEIINNGLDLANQAIGDQLENEIAGIRQRYAQAIADLRELAANDPQAMEALNKVILAQETEIIKARQASRDKQLENTKQANDKEEDEWLSFMDRLQKAATDNLERLGLDPQEAQAVVGSFKQVFASILDAYGENIDLQIEAKQRQVQALTTQIDEVQQELEREQELQKLGYANNVKAKEEEVAKLKSERDKQLADERRLQKERAKLAALEIAQSTITQTVTLGEAAAKIFKAHAGIPFAGVAIAAAAVAAMVAGFLSIKARLRSAQDQVPKFRKGGALDLAGAPSHEAGGVGLYNEQTGERIAELEGGERVFVVSKGASAKHKDLLEAINQDNLGGMSRSTIGKLLQEIGGVHLEQAPGTVLSDQRRAAAASIAAQGALLGLANLNELSAILEELRDFRSQHKNKPVALDLGDVIELREGNHIKRYRKPKNDQ